MRRNPGKATHLRRAKAKLESARGQYRSVQAAGSGEAGFRQEILLLAHMTAAQAVQEAANAGSTRLRDDAYHVQQLIESHLSRLRTPGKTNPVENPSVRRFADYPVAKRDAARKAKRTDTTHYVYELSQNPKFAVMSGDHPVQQSYENGVIGLGKAKLRHTERAPAPNPIGTSRGSRGRRKKKNPYETKGKATVAGKDEYKYRGHRLTLIHHGDWHVDIDPKLAHRETLGHARAPSRDMAIEVARLQIDRSKHIQSLGAKDQEGFSQMDQIIREMAGNIGPNPSLTRGALARAIEYDRRRLRKEWEDMKCGKDPDPEDALDCSETAGGIAGFRYFDSLSLPDRLRWLDSVVKEERLIEGLSVSNPGSGGRRKKKNPYVTKGVATPAGLGHHKDRYTYRGFEIVLRYGNLAGEQVWKAMVSRPKGGTTGVKTQALAGSPQARQDGVLEWARLYIDHLLYRESIPRDDEEKFDNLNNELWKIIYGLAHDGFPVTRSEVARSIEVDRTDDLQSWSDHDCDEAPEGIDDPDSLCYMLWERLRAHGYFDSLPLPDRLKWIDGNVKQYRLGHGLALPNPSADEKKAKKIIKGLTPIPEHITIQRLPPGPEPPSPLLPYEGAYYMGGSRARKTRGAASGSGAHRHPLARPARKKKKKDNPDRRAAFRRMMRL